MKKENKILIISQDLIIANHLVLILSQQSYSDFNIIGNADSHNELIKFGGYKTIFLFNHSKVNPSTLKLLNESSSIIYYVLSKHITCKSMDSFTKKNNVKVLDMPFTNLELKKVFASTG